MASYESVTTSVRGKCSLARQIFAQAALAPEYALNQGYPNGKNTVDMFRALIEPREYSINNVFIGASTRGALPFVKNLGGGDYMPRENLPAMFYRQNMTEYDFSGVSLLRGYLQPMTLTEYCTARNLAQRATRVYIGGYSAQDTNYGSQATVVCDATSRKYINEFTALADKIVPVITWYYTDSMGARVSKYQSLAISYFYSTNKSNVGKWTREQVPFSGGYQDKYVSRADDFTLLNYGISAPYVSSNNSNYNTGRGVPLNGIAYCRKSGDDMQVTLSPIDNPIYTLVNVGYYDNALSESYQKLITGGAFAGYNIVQLYSVDLGGYYVPLFNSIDDIIKLFDDFGVVVTTDWDEVLSPIPTPDEIAEINPDPTDREIESFPDNTTDNTPIEPAYITPSTFGQSCVYNPTTTRDFLQWVCNSTVDIGNWARLFANPADVITGINLYNLDIVAHDSTHVEAKTETNILGVTTPIPNYAILGGYNNIVDGGTLHLQAYYGNYADFTSMTYQMYVPFVGFTTLRACDVVNKTLHLYYAVDFATGSAVAFVNSDNKLIYTSPCTVAGKIPLSTSDRNSQMINNTLSVLGGLSGLLGGVASGNIGGGVGALMGGLGGLQMQTNYSNKGSLSAVNIYKLLPAFVERTRYDLFLPSNDSTYLGAKYQSYAGAPSTQFDTLLNCVNAGGFVQSDVVYLTSQTATETEKQQIIDLIKSGIYL